MDRQPVLLASTVPGMVRLQQIEPVTYVCEVLHYIYETSQSASLI